MPHEGIRESHPMLLDVMREAIRPDELAICQIRVAILTITDPTTRVSHICPHDESRLEVLRHLITVIGIPVHIDKVPRVGQRRVSERTAPEAECGQLIGSNHRHSPPSKNVRVFPLPLAAMSEVGALTLTPKLFASSWAKFPEGQPV